MLIHDHIRQSWPAWAGKEIERLEMTIQVRGRHSSRRAVVLVGEQGSPTAEVVIKGANGGQARFVKAEHAALTKVSEAVQSELKSSFPIPHDIFELNRWAFLVTSLVGGRPMESLSFNQDGGATSSRRDRKVWSNYVTGACDWSAALASETSAQESRPVSDFAEYIERFMPLIEAENVRREFRTLARLLRESHDRWSPAWQHGDLAVENMLVDKGTVRVIDWERSDDQSPPWRDLAYLPMMSVMQAHQRRVYGTITDALGLLDERSWAGGMIKEQLEARWTGPLSIGWGILLTTIDTAYRAVLRASGRERLWVEAATALVTDSAIRSEIGWICPEA